MFEMAFGVGLEDIARVEMLDNVEDVEGVEGVEVVVTGTVTRACR